ncbi:MAG TPA: multidrug transporter [Microbacterium sp.]|nr:multidrug transporter [Microbacterium sp.]
MTRPDENGVDQMTDEEKRHDQLTAAPDATEADAAPRIEVSEHDGITRIDIAPDAPVRPGPGPGAPAPEDEER